MPFLGPLIVAWIVLAVVVMAAYFLVVARPDTGVEQPWEAPLRARSESPARTAWVRPRWAEPQPEGAAPEPVFAPVPSNLPRYDMEDFPADHWSSSDVPTVEDADPEWSRDDVGDQYAADYPGSYPGDFSGDFHGDFRGDEEAEVPAPRAPRARTASTPPSVPGPSAGPGYDGYDMENFPADNWDSLSVDRRRSR